MAISFTSDHFVTPVEKTETAWQSQRRNKGRQNLWKVQKAVEKLVLSFTTAENTLIQRWSNLRKRKLAVVAEREAIEHSYVGRMVAITLLDA